jgi:hypothetical protein
VALTEETIQDKIEVVGEFKFIQVRTATIIKKDGTEISRTFSRHIVTPNISADNLAKESTEVQGIANSVWTDEIKTAYAKKIADETKELS